MGLLHRVFGPRHMSPPSPQAPPVQSDVARLRRSALAEFLTAKEPFENYDHLLYQAEDLGVSSARAHHVLRQAWADRVLLAEENQGRDTSLALRQVFATLESKGIIARENYGTTEDEGHLLMVECEGTRQRYTAAVGYVFFHRQDAERLLNGPGTLYLHFAALVGRSVSAEARARRNQHVGHEILGVLRGAGFDPRWSGRGSITIADVAWYAMPGASSP